MHQWNIYPVSISQLHICRCPALIMLLLDTIYGNDPHEKRFKICIIGAGAGGLAALKIIRDTPQHKSGEWYAVAYEAREEVGGIWYACDE